MTAESTRGAFEPCQRRDGFGPCHEVATEQVMVGCVHEHVGVRQVCKRCLDITLASEQGCVICWDHDGHWCPLIASAEADAHG